MNLESLKQLYRSPDLRKRALVVIGLLVVFRFLAHVPVPVPDNAALLRFLNTLFNSNRLLGFANLFSGGALSNFSIVMMGLGPYINASIIVQLLTQAVPKLEAISKEGEAGRRKLNMYTRYLTLPLALAQSFAMVLLIQRSSIEMAQTDLIGRPDMWQWILMIATIAGGSMLLMWIGEIISEKGIGNGISLLIFAGIVADFPNIVGQINTLVAGDSSKLLQAGLFGLATVGVIYAVVMLNEAQRNIPVSYAKRVRGSRIYSGVDTHLPLRLITAGVIPIIFALAFLSVPGFVGQVFASAQTPWLADFARSLNQWFAPTSGIYATTYFGLVILFTYLYTFIVFNPKDISENIQKAGGFIPGIRPGVQTSTYLRSLVNRLTLAGSIGLGAVAVLPFIAQAVTKSNVLTLGGTGLLIVVSVAIETMKQIQAQAVTASYEKY